MNRKNNTKKLFSLIGLAGGIIVILVGLLVMTGSFGGDASTASGASYLYDSGYATFGADFYNYVSNNAAEAASAARTVAGNIKSIAGLMKNVCGLSLMAFGLFMTCFFGIKYAEFNEACAAEGEVKAEEVKPAEEFQSEEAAAEVQSEEVIAEAAEEVKEEAQSDI